MRGIFVGFVVLVALVGVRGGNLVLKGKGKDKQGEDQEWWQSSVLYQIYPRSFMDSDGDGVGDIKGITSKLDYLVELGIRSVWLSPVYESPMKDFGYDISNFTNIDPIFGTLEDFFEMQEAMKDRGIKLVMDLVPNHSSDQHEWFNRSLAGEAPYDDYYVWVDPKFDDEGERQPPSNWLSVFGGSAWTYREEREQYFLHQFLPEQPDVNGYNENLIQALSDVFQFWLDMGVDGFRVDAIKHFAEIEDYYQDEAESGIPDLPEGNYENLYHNLTTNQQQTFDVLRRWRLLLDAATEASGSPKYVEINYFK
ncbi:unnamed protein product [Darwinula stevensoni]|uniref:alpha-glucosidase n=1 Tax=Darwinula stevensoni TaxID=69355 RepID=A0A7R9FRV1_9CRUS|nr:unnamed protein product [Darwinula stevensoni]CAG0902011.1 unnamed protein product [Darwinula stevensoni]